MNVGKLLLNYCVSSRVSYAAMLMIHVSMFMTVYDPCQGRDGLVC